MLVKCIKSDNNDPHDNIVNEFYVICDSYVPCVYDKYGDVICEVNTPYYYEHFRVISVTDINDILKQRYNEAMSEVALIEEEL